MRKIPLVITRQHGQVIVTIYRRENGFWKVQISTPEKTVAAKSKVLDQAVFNSALRASRDYDHDLNIAMEECLRETHQLAQAADQGKFGKQPTVYNWREMTMVLREPSA